MALTGQVASQVLQRMQISGSIRCCTAYSALAEAAMLVSPWVVPGAIAARPWVRASVEAYVLEVHRLPVDADGRGRDPAGELARLDHPAHQRGDKGAVSLARQPVRQVGLPLQVGHHVPIRRHVHPGEGADLAVKRLVRNPQPEPDAGLLDHPVPALDPADRVLDVIVAQ